MHTYISVKYRRQVLVWLTFPEGWFIRWGKHGSGEAEEEANWLYLITRKPRKQTGKGVRL